MIQVLKKQSRHWSRGLPGPLFWLIQWEFPHALLVTQLSIGTHFGL